jgi:hypothetical protein
MISGRAAAPHLLALSDLHVAYPENRKIVAYLRPESAADWLLVAGDGGERFADIEWVLRVGYPREWRRWQDRGLSPGRLRQILPVSWSG